MLYEVVNGIAERGLAGMEILKTIPLAPIPGGTGNGLAKSVLFECDDECYSAKSATFLAIKGSSSPFDLSEVATTTERKYAFLSMSWGLISDLDIRSEWMRCIGEIRLHLAAFYFLWPVAVEDGALDEGYVQNIAHLEAMCQLESAGVSTRFPHASHLYRVLLSKEWMAALCLDPAFRCPATTNLSVAQVARCPRKAAAVAMRSPRAFRAGMTCGE